jgi:hypothetical protein
MSAENTTPEIALIIAEAQRLLEQRPWDIREGAYLRGEHVRIVLMPMPSEEGERFDIPITMHPLTNSPDILMGTPIVVNRVAERGFTWFGHLNRRGQVLFRALGPGMYQARIVLPAGARDNARSRITFARLPDLDQTLTAAASTDKRRWQHTYRNASGSLTATLRKRESGELELSFETKLRDWNGAVVGFRWCPQPGEVVQLFAPLTWSEEVGSCVAQVSLGRAPQRITAPELLEHPIRAEQLAELPPAVIDESVAHAAWAQTRQAWHRLLDEHGDRLPPEMRDALRKALARASGTY